MDVTALEVPVTRANKLAAKNMFDGMKSIVDELEAPFMQAYLEDFTKHDYDSIVNDAQANDLWFWVIKSNGCGTNLFFLGDTSLVELLSCISDDSIYFSLKFNGINKGVITQIDKQTAITITRNHKKDESRKPRRDYLSVVLARLLSIESSDFLHTRLNHELSLIKGDKAYIKVTAAEGTYIDIRVTVLREPSTSNDDIYLSKFKKVETYSLGKTMLYLMLNRAQTSYYQVEGISDYHAISEEITKRKWDSRMKKLL